jgi:hypothetical protein
MCAKSTQWRLTRTTALRACWTSSAGNFRATYYLVIQLFWSSAKLMRGSEERLWREELLQGPDAMNDDDRCQSTTRSSSASYLIHVFRDRLEYPIAPKVADLAVLRPFPIYPEADLAANEQQDCSMLDWTSAANGALLVMPETP